MGKRRRALLLASMSIMFCVAVLVAGTFALFSDRATITNHLEAGTLKVKLVRTKLECNRLDTDGIAKAVAADTTEKDFTSASTDNVFGMSGSELIAPSSSYKATMYIANNGGTVAFDYKVKIVIGASDSQLAEQIKVIVNGDTENAKYLSDYVAGNDYVVKSGLVKTDGSLNGEEFSVKLVFENRSDNNAAQAKQARFDMIVEATQHTEAV